MKNYYYITLIIFVVYVFYNALDIINQKILLNVQGNKLKKFIVKKDSIKNNYDTIYFCFLCTVFICLANCSLVYRVANNCVQTIKINNKIVNLSTQFNVNFKHIYIIYIFFSFASFFILFLKNYRFFCRFFEKNDEERETSIENMYFNDNLMINKKGLYQNVLITGSIGSGKTSTGINNFLKYFIANKIGGLILDIKGTYIEKVKELMKNTTLNLVVLSLENSEIYNPLDKPCMSSYELAAYIRNVLEISSNNNSVDSYWIDKIENTLHAIIILIRLNKEIVSFTHLHNLISSQNSLQDLIKKLRIDFLSNKFNENEIHDFNFAVNYINNEFNSLDQRIASIIKSEITRITIPFVSSLKAEEKFCNNSTIEFKKENIIVLSMNIGENKAIVKVISAFLKEDYQRHILATINRDTPMFFICDEYQEFALASDGEFLGLCREAKCINVLAMQSYTSLKNKLKDEDATKIIIQNCINKIWYRQDDNYTILETIKQLGKEKKENKTETYAETAKESKYNIFTRKFSNYNAGITQTFSISENNEYIYDENFFSVGLKTFEALVLISNGEYMNKPEKIQMKDIVVKYEENYINSVNLHDSD